MEDLLRFLSLAEPNTRYVVIGILLLCGSASVVGTFTLLRGRALLGDAVAHAILPGICVAFLLQGDKSPWALLLGAFIAGWLSILAVDYLSNRTPIKPDTAIGIVLSVGFGLGILLLTYIQRSGNAAQSGLDKFLFGKAATLTADDVMTFGMVAALLLVTVLAFKKELALLCFDADYARSLGLPVRLLELLLTTLSVLAVVVGIQAVGVVLMAAVLITPGVAARQLTHHLGKLLFLAGLFGVLSGIAGTYVSYQLPQMPTGPWVVLFLSFIAGLVLVFAPNRGILARWQKQRANRRQILGENILKTLYHLGEAQADNTRFAFVDVLRRHTGLEPGSLMKGLRQLKSDGLVSFHEEGYQLTAEGMQRARRVVKLHRLWEAYLMHALRIPADHVHDDAETLEHLITPELEAELEQILNKPTADPHDRAIPY